MLQTARDVTEPVGAHGSPLRRGALEARVRVRTRAQYGVSVGPHRFRTSLTTISAIVDGTNPLATALVLGHSAAVGLKSYNRANNLAASRSHDAYISVAEDAAARMLRKKASS